MFLVFNFFFTKCCSPSFFVLASCFVAASAFQKGAYLNYDETVVYDEAAALPHYMIVYRM